MHPEKAKKKKGYDLKIVQQLFGDDDASQATSADIESERERARASERERARETSPDRPERVRAQVPAVIFMEIGLLSARATRPRLPRSSSARSGV